ncbi:exodeoxyribonuclease V subunit gamma [Methylomonas sp. AM2-LC]|uniref:exodeoxyribonuclease V subunit gamma n=1 Tax=Methylomonas sp. AM2-LC TaxID=3153301 RepID=UPI003265C6DC
MFILHSSNKTENLLAHLVAVLKSAPLTSPFAEELFLIQSQGMERWLSQQLAEQFKVWGNFRYLFPTKFFNSLSACLDKQSNENAFDRHLLLWRIETLLRDIEGEVFKPIHYFLNGENNDLKRYQLAWQLTRIFDQYQMLRPDLLDAWQQGRSLYNTASEAWQRNLWLALVRDIGTEHRGEQWRKNIQLLQQNAQGQLGDILPERILVFGINSMPPLLLDYLQALSQHSDVHLFLFNPVQNYWADLPSKRLQIDLTTIEAHPLLVGLGQQGREFQQLLLERVSFAFEPTSFEADITQSNLQYLQNDLLNNQISAIKLQADNSISIHACHSRLREVQTLKNQLLATLEKHTDLELRDIVVMAPDIQLYAPFISAVFNDIQHAIADRSLRTTNISLHALLQFLNLSQTRLGWQSVLDLLEQSHVYQSFGLNEADLSLIRHWIEDTQVRWGQSATHKQSLGLPALNQNTWQATLDRLFMGYAMGSDDAFIDEVLPYLEIEGSASQALGGLNEFLQLLFTAADELQSAKTLSNWQSLLSHYAHQLLGNAYSQNQQQLNEFIAQISEIAAIHEQPISLTVLIAWLEGHMDETKSSNGFLRGQLTFCSMLPMRAIPFQVIALLGMNDGEFPKTERSPDFDLLTQQPRLGDRSRRADDRYQFLEVLLSTRRQLILTYIGQSQQDNSHIPPSVIVSELQDVLRDCYELDNLVIYHPLHAFSSRYFDNSHPSLFSYSQNDYVTARDLGTEKAQSKPWWQGTININHGEVILIDELLQFYNHPQRFFLQQQLGIFLPQIPADPEEREPFVLDGLSRYKLQQQWIAQLLRGKAQPLAKMQAQGHWPAGALGEVEWQRQQVCIHEFVNSIQAKNLGSVQPAQAFDYQIGPYRLLGKLENRYSNGSLLYRYSSLKGSDFMSAWLHHLLINTQQAQLTYLLSKDKDLLFKPEMADQQILQKLLDLFVQGKQRPDIFFTQASFYYLQQKNPSNALPAVIKHMSDSIEKGYEPEICQVLAHRDLTTVFNDTFEENCQTLLVPAWSSAYAE